MESQANYFLTSLLSAGMHRMDPVIVVLITVNTSVIKDYT